MLHRNALQLVHVVLHVLLEVQATVLCSLAQGGELPRDVVGGYTATERRGRASHRASVHACKESRYLEDGAIFFTELDQYDGR